MRKSFDTLAALVANTLALDPLSGHLFLFSNRSRNRLEFLVFERGGYWLVARRLECVLPTVRKRAYSPFSR
jgi:transposase